MTAKPIHPGEILKDELTARDLRAHRLALDLGVPANRITAILRGQRRISADTALRLAHYLGTGARFWMDLQSHYDLECTERERGEAIRRSVRAA